MDVDAFAANLIEARRSGKRIAALDAAQAPSCAEDAYAVQDAMLRRLGGAIGGWKAGASSPEAEPQAAPLLADRMQPSPARFTLLSNALRTVEAELAFSFARDLPPRPAPYAEDEVWDSVEAMHVAIEILESSFVDRRRVPEFAPLADMQNNGGFCYGPALREWRSFDVGTPRAILLIDGEEVRSAISGTPGGHPRRLLAWLANHAARRGHPLKRRDIVTTGSHTGMYDAPAGAHVTARFEGVGEASLTFAA
ncbi:MAG TPA: 2-keto-4-pentenoate hydratase [Stellaceae bacterium]|nr:2-keto-4-pentenoate hydratase [Stellaceae bacterium]